MTSTCLGTRRHEAAGAPLFEYGRALDCPDGKAAWHNDWCIARIWTVLTKRDFRINKRVSLNFDGSAERRVEQAHMTDYMTK